MELKIAVTPKGYDDIGAVMKKLEYSFTTIAVDQLAQLKRLTPFDVVFINCAGTVNPAGAAKTLQQFVAQGGTLYVSDWAADYVVHAFPKLITFAGRSGKQGHVTAQVVDSGLRGMLGSSIRLHFDMGSWVPIAQVSKDVQTYMAFDKSPILVSFVHGKGSVVYTAFHNHAQVSDHEAQLLQYLVLKPLMAQASVEMLDFAWTEKKQLQETVGKINQNETSAWYSYQSSGSSALTARLNWKGDARLGLEIKGPGGTQQQQSDSPPLSITLPAAQPGQWQYRITGHQVSTKNFPFVLLIGPSDQVAQANTLPPLSTWAGMGGGMDAQVDPNVLASIKLLDGTDREQDGDLEINILD